jgi:hypothetical protein
MQTLLDLIIKDQLITPTLYFSQRFDNKVVDTAQPLTTLLKYRSKIVPRIDRICFI